MTKKYDECQDLEQEVARLRKPHLPDIRAEIKASAHLLANEILATKRAKELHRTFRKIPPKPKRNWMACVMTSFCFLGGLSFGILMGLLLLGAIR